jgi:hypothetical protein
MLLRSDILFAKSQYEALDSKSYSKNGASASTTTVSPVSGMNIVQASFRWFPHEGNEAEEHQTTFGISVLWPTKHSLRSGYSKCVYKAPFPNLITMRSNGLESEEESSGELRAHDSKSQAVCTQKHGPKKSSMVASNNAFFLKLGINRPKYALGKVVQAVIG